MDITIIESFAISVGIPALSLILNGYVSLRKSNIELFFRELLKSGHDFSLMKNSEDLQRHFIYIIDKVSLETNVEKIKKWKNAVINLTSDFKDFDFKDNFISSLESLSVFDLTVLSLIYSKEPSNAFDPHFAQSITKKTGAYPGLVLQAYKKLLSHNLLEEEIKAKSLGGEVSMRYGGSGEVEDMNISIEVFYKCNPLGKQFLKFIGDDYKGG